MHSMAYQVLSREQDVLPPLADQKGAPGTHPPWVYFGQTIGWHPQLVGWHTPSGKPWLCHCLPSERVGFNSSIFCENENKLCYLLSSSGHTVVVLNNWHFSCCDAWFLEVPDWLIWLPHSSADLDRRRGGRSTSRCERGHIRDRNGPGNLWLHLWVQCWLHLW